MGSYFPFFIAIDAIAPMLSVIARPGAFIILVLRRIFSAAGVARARFAAAHAGAGFRLGVAGVVFAGKGMGFIPVRDVNAPVVIQRLQLRIGAVVAAGTGVVGVPALFRAGGGLRGMVEQVVSQRRQLRISAVVAAGAGVVGVPADLGTGSRLGLVVDQVVVVGIYIAGIKGIYLVCAIGTDPVIFRRGCAGGLGMHIFRE